MEGEGGDTLFLMQGNVLCWGKFLTDVSCNDSAGKALGPETFDSKGWRKDPPLFLFHFLFNILFPCNCPPQVFMGNPYLGQPNLSDTTSSFTPNLPPFSLLMRFLEGVLKPSPFSPLFFWFVLVGLLFFGFWGFFFSRPCSSHACNAFPLAFLGWCASRGVQRAGGTVSTAFVHAKGCCKAEGSREQPRWGRVVVMYLNYSRGGLAWASGKSFSQWGEWSPGTDYVGRMWAPHPWRVLGQLRHTSAVFIGGTVPPGPGEIQNKKRGLRGAGGDHVTHLSCSESWVRQHWTGFIKDQRPPEVSSAGGGFCGCWRYSFGTLVKGCPTTLPGRCCYSLHESQLVPVKVPPLLF